MVKAVFRDWTEAALGQGLADALAELPDVAVRSVKAVVPLHGRRIDWVLLADVKGRPVRFLVETKASGYPRDAQAAVWQLAGVRDLDRSVVDVPLFVAPAISTTSRDLLRRQRFGYWDTGGSLYIDLPWALYWVDRPVPASQSRALRQVFRGSTARVFHALLLDPHRAWQLTELAQRAQVSVSTAHQACTFLEAQLWLEKAGAGRQTRRLLREPGALLDAWAATHSLAEYQPDRFHRWARHPRELLRGLGAVLTDQNIAYALTLSSGAQYVAPHGTGNERVWVLVPRDANLTAVQRAAELQAVDEGENVTFFVVRDRSPLLFRRPIDGLWVASDVQLYLDLAAWPQRGLEQARHLRTERLGY